MRKSVTEQRWNLHYNDIVLSTNPIAYWPLDEKVGTVAWDWVSGRVASAQNGAHVGVTLGEPGIGDGMTCPYYDGTNDYTNVLTAPFAAAFNGSEGSLMIWWKQHASAFNDAVIRRAVMLYVDAQNHVILNKTGTNANWQMNYRAGNVLESSNLLLAATRTEWSCSVMTWSFTGDAVRYYDAGLNYETDTVLGVWAGALPSAIIGATNTTPTGSYYGWLAHCAVWNRALSAGECDMLYKARY